MRAARVIVDRRVLQTEGAHALYIEGLSIRTETVAQTRGRRPWVPLRAAASPKPMPNPRESNIRNLDDAPENDPSFGGDLR
jgi:hypothetical protein